MVLVGFGCSMLDEVIVGGGFERPHYAAYRLRYKKGHRRRNNKYSSPPNN
jgi:hypothetical protein